MEIITPRKTKWEKLRDWFASFSPQVKQAMIAAIVAVVLFIGGCLFVRKPEVGMSNKQTATTAGVNSPINQAGRDLTINNTLVITNEGQTSIIDLDTLERRYPYGFILFRPDGSKTKVLQTFHEPIKLDWDSVRVIKESPETLSLTLPQIEVFVRDIKGTLPPHILEHVQIENKTSQMRRLLEFGINQKYVGLYFEVLDNHPIRPFFVLGVCDSVGNRTNKVVELR